MRSVPGIFLICALTCTLIVPGARGQTATATDNSGAAESTPGRDALTEHFFSPSLIVQNAEQLQLSDDQRTAIEGEMETLQTQIPELQEELQTEIQSLAGQIKSDSDNEEAVLSQLENVLEKERDIKRLQLTALLRVRNQLTPAQQQSMQRIRQQMADDQRALGQRLQQKLRRVQAGVQQLAAQGQQPTEIVQMLQPFNDLMRQGKFAEAEALVDQALLKLGASP